MLMAAMLLLVASCNNESVENVSKNNAEQTSAPVRVSVNDFAMSMSEVAGARGLTRAEQDPATYKDVGAITLAFYDTEGTEVYQTTQFKSETAKGFGTFTANLPIGAYTMVAVAYAHYEGDTFVLTSPTEAAFTTERPRETFCKTQSVLVTASGVDLEVTLTRISSWLTIQSTDARPASATKVRTVFAQGAKSFNPSTGLATTDDGFSQVNNPSKEVGSPVSVTSLPFLYTDEEDIDITIEVLDAEDHILFSHTVPAVPFKRNRKTTLKGALFTADISSTSFKLETDWLESSAPIDF